MLTLQKLPTEDWTEDDLEALIAKAFELQQLYHFNNRLSA
jgi:hypothetical protein